MTSRTDVVVIAYRSQPTLERCLESALVAAANPRGTIVINNDPVDRSVAVVAERFGILTAESIDNVGFCAAVNRALASTSAPYVLLLNPDAAIAPDYVARLVEHMERDPSIASAGGRILRSATGSSFVDSLGIEIGRGRRATDIGHGEVDDGRRMGIDERFGVTAAAAVYRRSALEAVAVGGQVLPEDFFMYLDDVDLAWRLRLAGYRAIVDHAALAWHGRGIAGDRNGRSSGLHRLTSKIAREMERPDYVRELSWVNHMLMLVRNDDPGGFLTQFAYYGLRRTPGDLFGVVQRPAMALRTRQRWLRLVPSALRARREIQSRRVVGARDMARWLP